jgi:hypothetical protein
VAAVSVLVLRRPEAVVRPQFFAESAPVFYVPTYFHDPLTLIATPYAGYLHLIPRLSAYVERLVDPYWAPVIGSILSFLVVVAIAAFLASGRMSAVLPHKWQRLAVGGMILLSPSVYEVLGVEVNLQVYLAAYLAALSVARPATSRLGEIGDLIGAAASSLSGPFAVLLAPLFWLRRDRLAAAVGVCAGVQLIAILNSPQRAFGIPSLSAVIDVTLLRVNAAVLGPSVALLVPAWVALGLGAMCVLVAFRVPRKRAWMALGYGAIVVAIGGLATDGAALAINPRWGERFFLLPSVTVAALVSTGVAGTDRVAMVCARILGVLLVIGVLIDFRVPAFADAKWRVDHDCIGRLEPCFVRGYPDAFTFRWPGRDGEYPLVTRRWVETPVDQR